MLALFIASVAVGTVGSVEVAGIPVAIGRLLSVTFVTVGLGEEELARGEVVTSSLPLGNSLGTVALSIPQRRSNGSRIRSGESMSMP
ncbi:hypothetical protein [Cryobacterium sp. Y57]|uniref:hypothetical protein n=1 Tax=Cryobacterium sp. Y57 TaxID=2048287 RepID=UPI000CE48C2F|nr:hypothetical protein [Cryobacterium sp. Y57]